MPIFNLVAGVYRIKIPVDNRLYMQLDKEQSRVLLSQVNDQDDQQKWRISPVVGKPGSYRITSYDGAYTLSWKSGGPNDKYEKGYLVGVENSSTEWIVEHTFPHGPRIRTADKNEHFVDSCDGITAHFWDGNTDGVNQHWAFDFIHGLQPEPAKPLISNSGFQNKFFTLSVEQAAQEAYDIIIVGSGIGGGVLANDLYDTNFKRGKHAKKILLLEKGDLVFHTHCLNTARPAGLENNRGQQNDTFFAQFKDDYAFTSDTDTKDWKGGPMYNLGGRSAAWGLFAPRIHDDTLNDHFPAKVAKDLNKEYYDKVERLMKLSLPQTKTIHQHVMDRLNMDGLAAQEGSAVQWQWGRIASEFHDEHNFDFAEGAYSSIDKILEIAMSKSKEDGLIVEHENFKTVLGAEVRSLAIDHTQKTAAVTGVNVRTSNGKEVPIKINPQGSVVLCAGSVHSPAILLRSGDRDWQDKIRDAGGLRLTDHDILYYTHSFRYSNRKARANYGAMKLQTYVKLGKGNVALANMSIDASSFLPRGYSPDDSLPQFIMVFILETPLIWNNNITIDPKTNEPVVTMARADDPDPIQLQRMKILTAKAMESLKETMGIQFVGNDKTFQESDIELQKLQLGGVAHELGTLPMTHKKNGGGCLDGDLTVVSPGCSGLYVCDLSCFPHSPESNPTLTLGALAIRLSRKLHPRKHVTGVEPDDVVVVNHSGSVAEVWLTNAGSVTGQTEEKVVIEPGDFNKWKRKFGVDENLFVYKLDQSNKVLSFLTEPAHIPVHPGKVCAIL